ncbi:GGDEF domain-containing protein [Bacillaceae bacterium IKA-2]|nr:GGDEF domain-containing protein [Bacillaceae bacterium IKA-2]
MSFNLIGFEWTNVVFLVISIILLNHYMILLPPKGNAISMDSAVYLATTFIFGLEITLIVLLIGSLIFALYQHKISWWKHLTNFSISSIMIISAYYTFILLGGQIGFLHMETTYVYIGTLVVYYAINIIFVGFYFIIGSSENVITFFKDTSTEILFSYLSTLVMTVILGVLIISHGLFGLLLFTSIVVLLSMAFKQYYNLYEEVAKKANTDSLTGLYNHSYFKEVLADFLKNRKGLKLCLALIDIDDFKKFNDNYGHLAGDDLLKKIGALLKEGCKKQEFFVARYGGEEFVIIMENVNKKAAVLFLNTLRKQINDSYYEGVDIFPHRCLSFSGGVTEYDEGVYNSAELIGKADQAMYFAKAQGKNNVQLFDNITITSSLLDHEKEIELLEQQVKFFLYKDVYTYKHSRRVYQYAKEFSNHLQLSDYEKKC